MHSQKFCILPWIHLATHPHGGASLCCRVDFADSKGMAYDHAEDGSREFLNVNRHSLEQITNSEVFREARRLMLKGEEPLACKGCFNSERAGIESKRQRENKNFNFDIEEATRLTDVEGAINPNYKFVELRLGNICNLKCCTCNPISSMKWTSDYKSLSQELDFLRSYETSQDFSWPEKASFWKDLMEHSQDLEMLYINGGEPTLIESHWSFLESLVDKGVSGKISLNYNINMTQIPDRAFAVWKKFKSVYVGSSIDDCESRNHYIRYPTKWELVLSCIEKLKAQNISFGITQTVSIYNFFYLDKLYNFAKSNNINIWHNYVYDPEFLSPQALPLAVRQRILKHLNGKLPANLMEPLRASYSVGEDLNLFEQFKRYNRALDKLRKEKFATVFHEFYDLLADLKLHEEL